MADADNKREAGASLMFVGLSVVVVDLLVVFFLPAAVKLAGIPCILELSRLWHWWGWRLSRRATECAGGTTRNK